MEILHNFFSRFIKNTLTHCGFCTLYSFDSINQHSNGMDKKKFKNVRKTRLRENIKMEMGQKKA